METAGTGRRKANSQFTGVLGISTRHECRRLFVTYLNKLNFVGTFSEGLHNSIDAVAWQAKDHINSPIMNAINQNVRCGGFHAKSPFLIWTLRGSDCQRFAVRSERNCRCWLQPARRCSSGGTACLVNSFYRSFSLSYWPS